MIQHADMGFNNGSVEKNTPKEYFVSELLTLGEAFLSL